MFRRLLTCLLSPALISTSALAEQPEHPERPLMWKVEGQGLQKPSYLFGTIHLGGGAVGTLHPTAAKALTNSDATYTEVPMDMASQLGLAKHFIRDDGKTLSASIGDELSKQLDAELKAVSPTLNADPFQSFKTWAIAVTIPMLKAQLAGSTPLDMVVWNKASEAGKKTDALEKPKDQFQIFDDLTEEEQIILLSESLRLQREARADKKDPVEALINAYVSGDPKKVEAEMEVQLRSMAEGEHKELSKKLLKRLLQDRNINMAEGMVARFKAAPNESNFFAVGAGHYVGKDNIRDILTNKGYKVTLVTE